MSSSAIASTPARALEPRFGRRLGTRLGRRRNRSRTYADHGPRAAGRAGALLISAPCARHRCRDHAAIGTRRVVPLAVQRCGAARWQRLHAVHDKRVPAPNGAGVQSREVSMGMNGWVGDIEAATLDNDTYRTVLFTGSA